MDLKNYFDGGKSITRPIGRAGPSQARPKLVRGLTLQLFTSLCVEWCGPLKTYRAVLSPLQLALIYVFMHDTSIYMSRTYSYREHTVQCTVQYTGYMFDKKNRNIIFDEFLVFGP
jgi:hypothetical protein